MLMHPQFDPVALSLGPLAVRWYGLMYLLAFVSAFILLRYRIRHYPWVAASWRGELDDMLFYLVLGVIVGGRLGEVLFYQPAYYAANPLDVVKIWQGGMSFHGGLLGVLLALALWARKVKRAWWDLADFIAPAVPFGLALGRLGNFINGELWGRVASADLPWAMAFPRSGDLLPRHPSPLYQMLLEGLLLALILVLATRKKRPRYFASGLFLTGYGVLRAFAEWFREPDPGIFGFSYAVSMGQWLSLPMIVVGAVLLWRASRQTP